MAYGGGGIPFGTPTRFGNVAAQLKLFMDLAGELWQQGKLIDKVATTFTSSQTEHGGQESTILALNNTLYHWGAMVLPFTSGHRVIGPDDDSLVVARSQGARLARVARVIGIAREAGLLAAAPAPNGSP